MRPTKYASEEERKLARREQFRRANKNRKNNNNNNNNHKVHNNNNNNNLEIAYAELREQYEELVEHNKVNEDYIRKLEKELSELTEQEWY